MYIRYIIYNHIWSTKSARRWQRISARVPVEIPRVYIAMAWLPRNDSGHVDRNHLWSYFNHFQSSFWSLWFSKCFGVALRPSETTLTSTNTIRYLGNLHNFFQRRPLRSPKNLAIFPHASATNSPWHTPQVALCQPWVFSAPKNKLLRSDHIYDNYIYIYKVGVCGYVGFNRHPT